MSKYFFIFIVLLISILQSEQQNPFLLNQNVTNSRKKTTNCSKGGCYPETGDLLIGRTKFLHASSTCGLTQPERYCVLGTTRNPTKCFVCDSSAENENSHGIQNVVSRKQGDRFNRWWQSENGKQNVYIQFDLEAEFVFTHIIMIFKTFRPAAMIIEKSSDFGRSWKTYGFFASNCAEYFPEISTDMPKNLGDVYCESKYSSETPSTKGEIVFKILPPTLIQSRDPYSPEIQELLKITNLRINFTRLHTFGDNLLDSREELKEKYYYSIYEMVVRGSCLCYGHASSCRPVLGVQYDTDSNGMVDGQCECQHNTEGTNCEKCKPLFNDRPWAPARSGEANECKKCECNNHARSCHFDEEIYKESNFTSGGVCDNCEDNTEGRNCERCKQDFWRDPNKPIDDITTCKPCLCSKDGTTNDGKCDPFTDVERGFIAGRCHCKPLVEGPHCDQCKNGYFNLKADNPDGCEPCACNINGTVGNMGCHKVNGACDCKRFVTGRTCNECKDGYYGLSSENPDGCSPCDCSLGGSIDNTCDSQTGQCKCKPHMTGRRCDEPANEYFCPTLDFLTYEAETARINDPRSLKFLREVNPDRRKTWTGEGFVRAFEGSSIEFDVTNIFKTGNYEILIRYEHLHSIQRWENVRVTLHRTDGPPETSGECADYYQGEDYKSTVFTENKNSQIVDSPVCLEANKRYYIKLEFDRLLSSSSNSQKEPSILIDSIVLLPVVDELPVFQGNDGLRLKEEYVFHGCREAQLSVNKENMSPSCYKYICNIGVHGDTPFPCECDRSGSESLTCNKYGGECKCKQNVESRKCDKCALSTWGFGPNGCQPCNCNSAGAINNFCNVDSGKCECLDRVIGKQCDECLKGHWRFPYCEPCQCNGLSDTCDQNNGQCLECRNNTVGYYCENCKDGYYGDPTRGIPCKECMCPGGLYGNQFAKTCYLEQRRDTFVCQCEEGYRGDNCNQCDTNYYGNPKERGGSCKLCQCNGNTIPNDRNSCDELTGQCKNCLYNTFGDRCERCKPGYFGDALNKDCRPCNCNPYGTDGDASTNCDHQTGQCKCLPNVIGKRCDACEKDFFGLGNKEGCTYCNCDPEGTQNRSTTCDVVSGQCQCLSSRGGRTCSDCSFAHWGDPSVECKSCDCYQAGSTSAQCDKLTGACPCKKGITGQLCDKCDRGTYGEIPSCNPCGECYDDWSNIFKDLEDKLEVLEQKASNLAVGLDTNVQDFTAEYKKLEEQLADIKKVLEINYKDKDIKSLSDRVKNIGMQLTAKKESTKKYYEFENWNVAKKSELLEEIKRNLSAINEQTQELREEAMDLKESHELGAIDSIKKADAISKEAVKQVESVESKLNTELKPILNNLKMKIDESSKSFEKSDKVIQEFYDSINGPLKNAMKSVFGLNQAVCGELTSAEEKCSAKCGGSLCNGTCGTNSSSCPGLVDSYQQFLKKKSTFEDLYNKQEQFFKRILTKLVNSTNLLNNANKEINELLSIATKSLEQIESKKNDLNALTETIQKFINTNSEKPKKIEENVNHVVNTNIDLKESDLDEILNKINDIASTLNVEQVESDSEKSKLLSDTLLNSAELLESELPKTLEKFQNTVEAYENVNNATEETEKNLNEYKETNEKVDTEIKSSEENIIQIEEAMKQVQQSIKDLKSSVEFDSKDKTTGIIAKQDSLKSKVKESGVTLNRTKINLEILQTKLDQLTQTFQENSNGGEILNELIDLQGKINQKKGVVDQKLNKIKTLENYYDETRKRISELKDNVSMLKVKASDIKSEIQSKEKYFNTCS